MIFYDLNMADILAIGQTNTSMNHFAQAHIRCTIQRIFLRSNLPHGPLFQLLTRTRSVISGSSVLLALLPWNFEPGDIDIYTPRTQARVVIRALLRLFGFTLDPTTMHYLDMAGVHCVYYLRKGSVKINVIESLNGSSIAPLFFFHSTAVMNFMDEFGVYCAYPLLTFQRKSLLNSQTNNRSALSVAAIEKCVIKYQDRGFEFSADITDWVDPIRHICESDPYCPLTIRVVHDRGSFYHRSTKEVLPNRTRFDRVRETWCLDQQLSPLRDLMCVAFFASFV